MTGVLLSLLITAVAACAGVENTDTNYQRTSLGLRPVSAPNSTNVALNLSWPAFTNKWLYLNPATTNRTFLTNGGSVFEVTTRTNPIKFLADLTNYMVLNGFVTVTNTTNLSATVTYPRGAAPQLRVLIGFADGYLWDYGWFLFGSNSASALTWTTVESSTNLTAWSPKETYVSLVSATNKVEYFRSRVYMEPTKSNAWVTFQPNTLTVTNR